MGRRLLRIKRGVEVGDHKKNIFMGPARLPKKGNLGPGMKVPTFEVETVSDEEICERKRLRRLKRELTGR